MINNHTKADIEAATKLIAESIIAQEMIPIFVIGVKGDEYRTLSAGLTTPKLIIMLEGILKDLKEQAKSIN